MIDGDRNGQPGGAFTAIVTNKSVRPSAAQAGSIKAFSSSAGGASRTSSKRTLDTGVSITTLEQPQGPAGLLAKDRRKR